MSDLIEQIHEMFSTATEGVFVPSQYCEVLAEYISGRRPADWQPIESIAVGNDFYLFFQPGNPKATIAGARVPRQRVDRWHPAYQTGLEKLRWHEYPESPYTHWMPLPEPPK